MQIVDRVILVVDSRPDAVVGLRDRIPPERALLRRAQPCTVDTELAAVHPFPFAVVGVTRDGEIPMVSPQLVELVCSRPIPVAWWGEVPSGLPSHAEKVARWAEVRDTVVGLLASAPGGVRLADHRGLQHRGQRLRSPELEGLVAGHPRAFALDWRAAQRVQAAIARHRLPLRVCRPGAGLVGLEVAET
jgi:hypothetical protein